MDLSASNLFLIKKILNAQRKPIVYRPTVFKSDLRAYVTAGAENLSRYTDIANGLRITNTSTGKVDVEVTQYGYRYYTARLYSGSATMEYSPVVLDKSGTVTHKALLDDYIPVYTTEQDEPLIFRRYGSPGTFYFVVGWRFISSTGDYSDISNDDSLGKRAGEIYRNVSYASVDILNGTKKGSFDGNNNYKVNTFDNMFATVPVDILNTPVRCSALNGTIVNGPTNGDMHIYTCLIPMPLLAPIYSVKYEFKEVAS